MADDLLDARLTTLTAEDQDHMRFAMGPMELDLLTFLGMRLNEHSLHTWDVAVTFDASATLPDDEAALIVDALPMMARWAGKPTGVDQDISIRTVSPSRTFALALRPDGVTLSPGVRWTRPTSSYRRRPHPARLRAARSRPHPRRHRGGRSPRRAAAGLPGVLSAAGRGRAAGWRRRGWPRTGGAAQRLASTQVAMSSAMPVGSSSGPK